MPDPVGPELPPEIESEAEALTHACKLCKQPAGKHCLNVLTDKPLKDRLVHLYRREPK